MRQVADIQVEKVSTKDGKKWRIKLTPVGSKTKTMYRSYNNVFTLTQIGKAIYDLGVDDINDIHWEDGKLYILDSVIVTHYSDDWTGECCDVLEGWEGKTSDVLEGWEGKTSDVLEGWEGKTSDVQIVIKDETIVLDKFRKYESLRKRGAHSFREMYLIEMNYHHYQSRRLSTEFKGFGKVA